MATRYWEGGGTDNDDLADATNWSGNTLPGTGDTAIIAERPATETATFTASATLPASGTLAAFRVGPSITADFGDSDPTAITVNATVMDLSGQGVYQRFAGTQVTVNVNDMNMSTDALHLTGTVTTLRVLGTGTGTVNVANSATATNIELLDAARAKIIVGTSVTNSNITMSTGDITTSSNIATKANVLGGMLTVKGTATCAALDNHVTGLTTYNSSGLLGALIVYGGKVDFSSSTASSITVTTAVLYEGATIDERSGLNNVIYTNGITMRGGVVLTDIARTLTVSA
jgi:hypothetical protein